MRYVDGLSGKSVRVPGVGPCTSLLYVLCLVLGIESNQTRTGTGSLGHYILSVARVAFMKGPGHWSTGRSIDDQPGQLRQRSIHQEPGC